MSFEKLPRDDGKIHRYKFSEQEDLNLQSLVDRFGTKNWGLISQMMNGRTPRQCRDRWNHYLAPTTNSTNEWSDDEDRIIINELKKVGKQWTFIASLLPGRTSIAVRNRSCKLSRKRDCDPYVKELLKDEYKSKSDKTMAKKEVQNANAQIPSTSSDNEQKIVFPSCTELLKQAKCLNPAPNQIFVLYNIPFLVI